MTYMVDYTCITEEDVRGLLTCNVEPLRGIIIKKISGTANYFSEYLIDRYRVISQG